MIVLAGVLMDEMVYTLKLVVIGDFGVGKSSLITRYVKDKFDSDYISTIGVDFLVKEVSLKDQENAMAKIVIWDIGGQEAWRKKLRMYLKGADGAIVVCDLTRPKTANNVPMWIDYLKEYTGNNIPFILVGNKIDLKEKSVSKDYIAKLAGKENEYFLASAKTGEVVEQFFSCITELMISFKK